MFPRIQDNCIFLPLSAWSPAPALSASSLINWATGCCFCKIINSRTQLNFPSRTYIKKPPKQNNKETKNLQTYRCKGLERKGKPRQNNFPCTVCLLFVHSRYSRPFCGSSPCSRGVLAPTDLISVIKEFYSNKITSQKRAKCRDLEPTWWTRIISNTGASFNGFPLCSSCMFIWVPISGINCFHLCYLKNYQSIQRITGIDSIYLPNVFFFFFITFPSEFVP